MASPRRISLARLPTPLERSDRLTEAWVGPTIWVKRDDLTGFGISGNKVRKLEYHLAAAIDSGTGTIVTCGAAQSNHCRATALAAARLGLEVVLLLRTDDGLSPAHVTGNHLLQRLAGAECRFITPDQYHDRDALMADVAAELGGAWVIPEGASDALGSWGFRSAMEELAPQLDAVGIDNPVLWHAAMSAGTTSGMVSGTAVMNVAARIVGCSVGDPAADIAAHVGQILEMSDDSPEGGTEAVDWTVTDAYVGGGYGIVSEAEMETQLEATRLTGLIFDPTYTGKAIHGLREEVRSGTYGPGDDVIFWHTGGGFAAFAHDWAAVLEG